MNIGVLGHVDSGKTSLVKVLSTTASTGAFDKNAASANLRANTIDLGYAKIPTYYMSLLESPRLTSTTPG